LLRQLLFGSAALPEELAKLLPPARVIQVENAAKQLRGEEAGPVERTVKAQVDRWVSTQQARTMAGSLAPDAADLNRIRIGHFATFLGEPADVKIIDAERLHDYYLWCLRKAEWSATYKKGVFATARTWVRWLWEQGAIDPPRNLESKSFRFGGGAKRIETWTIQEVRRVVREAPGKLQLALLLMLNCGMTQGDVSDLLDSEVDWTEGRITRKRSKTADNENTPTVNYKLWSKTFALLKKHRSGGERVLLTESGRPFIRKETINGKMVKSDGFKSNYDHLKKRLGFGRPMKLLRKTAATMLEGHETYGRLVTLFLGHSPRSVKDRHYSAPPQELFDSALLWLGEQFGF
jgi:integrase